MIDAVSYPGCGTGVVCPIMQSNSARCNRCDFNSTTTVCGSVPGHHAAPTTPAPGDGSVCSTGEEKVYSGLDLAFTGKHSNACHCLDQADYYFCPDQADNYFTESAQLQSLCSVQHPGFKSL